MLQIKTTKEREKESESTKTQRYKNILFVQVGHVCVIILYHRVFLTEHWFGMSEKIYIRRCRECDKIYYGK